MGTTGLKTNGVLPVSIKNACLPPPKSSGILRLVRHHVSRPLTPRWPEPRCRSVLLLFARQKNPEWPLDGADACAREAFTAVRPGLCPLEVSVPPPECAAVLRLILAIARLP